MFLIAFVFATLDKSKDVSKSLNSIVKTLGSLTVSKFYSQKRIDHLPIMKTFLHGNHVYLHTWSLVIYDLDARVFEIVET